MYTGTFSRMVNQPIIQRKPLLFSDHTEEPIRAGQCAQLLPEFGTIEDTCRIFGLGRTKLYSYIKRGIVQSVCLREPGKATGKRLIHLQSVRSFLITQLNATYESQEPKGML